MDAPPFEKTPESHCCVKSHVSPGVAGNVPKLKNNVFIGKFPDFIKISC
jgi:hypothetical protein